MGEPLPTPRPRDPAHEPIESRTGYSGIHSVAAAAVGAQDHRKGDAPDCWRYRLRCDDRFYPLPTGPTTAEPRNRPADRREFKRIRFPFEAFVQMDGQKLRVAGLDAHRAGARITSAKVLPEGALVQFHVALRAAYQRGGDF
jgi:hypothetical protein